jgi:hypothetical protein
MKKILMLLFTSFILTGCYRTPVIDIRAEAEVIKNIEDQWTAAILAKDIDKIIDIFAWEAVTMNANTVACIGAQAIRESQESWLLIQQFSMTHSNQPLTLLKSRLREIWPMPEGTPG